MTIRPALVALAALTASAAPAAADTIAALAGGDTLVMIDVAEKRAAKPVKISGLPAAVVGLDMRPADGLLYALAADGTVATVDPATGKATVKSKLDTMVPAGAKVTVDFNPVADRLRVIGSDGTNLRANVDDGKVTTDGKLRYGEQDANKGKNPAVTAGAYVNSVKGAKETALYDLDTGNGLLVKQAPPNDGILVTVGALAAKDVVAFDIVADGQGGNAAWVLAGGALHKLDLATGKVDGAVKIEGLPAGLTDIAILKQG